MDCNGSSLRYQVRKQPSKKTFALLSASPIALLIFLSFRTQKTSDVSNIRVLVGTNNLRSGGTTYKALKSIIHEKYNKPKRLANDIALLQVENIQFNDKVQPIKYSEDFVNAGANLITSGWGRLGVSILIVKYCYLFETFKSRFFSAKILN